MTPEELSDRQQITDLVTAYTRAVDTARWDDLDAVFTEDAVLDYASSGGPVGSLADAKPFIANLLGFDRWQHLIGQVAIDFGAAGAGDGSDGGPDGAEVTAYFFNPMVARSPDGTETLHEVGGYYHHTVRRTAAGWRSERLVDEVVWTRGF